MAKKAEIENEVRKEPRKPPISDWKPTKENTIVRKDGKLFVCDFDRALGAAKLAQYNKFCINKESYENQLPVIVRYLNYFMDKYDEDEELVNGYLKIKFELDKKKSFKIEDMDAYIDFLYEILFTESMVEKIRLLVVENYVDDIEIQTNAKKKYQASGKSHMESLEFTNQHMRILLGISFGMKIMAPALFHYLSINGYTVEKNSMVIYNFYKKLFDLFGENCNIYNKLFVYVKKTVSTSVGMNQLIFDQMSIFGEDPVSVIRSFTKKVLISENIVKYCFPEIWDAKQHKYKESITGFNKTILKYQLVYFLQNPYPVDLTEVSTEKNGDGLSGQDKMEMNMERIDEGKVTLAEINVEMTIAMLKKDLGIEVTPEEVAYYEEYLVPSDWQIDLVRSYFAKWFGCFRDLKLTSQRDYITLMIILKKKLLIEAGFRDNDMISNQAALPFILSGNMTGKMNSRIIRNSKFKTSTEEAEIYQDLLENSYKLLENLKPNFILQVLSTCINTDFTYVVYENPELLGHPIEYDDVQIGYELSWFLKSIAV